MIGKILSLLVVGMIASPSVTSAHASGAGNPDTLYDIALPLGIPDPIAVSGTLTLDDNHAIVGSSDITAFSITVSGACGVYGSCFSQTMTSSNSVLSCNDCLVRTGTDLFISPNYTVGFSITSDAANCGPSHNQACAEVDVFTNHEDSEYFYSVCSSGTSSACALAGDGITTFGNVLVAQAVAAPEIDPASAISGLTLLLGGLIVLRGGRQQKLERAG